MDAKSNSALWAQFGGSIDMLENAIRACPDTLWGAAERPPFWYLAYHTLFFLDLYLSPSIEDSYRLSRSRSPSWIRQA